MSTPSFHAIRYAVACWLRYARQCPLVSFERGGHGWGWDHPDVFAVKENRETYDVEIKMSFSDFRADQKKIKFKRDSLEKTMNPDFRPTMNFTRPTWFYYAAPMELAEKIMDSSLLPGGAGLLGVQGFQEMGQDAVVVMLKAEKHKAGKRPSLRHMVDWVKDQSGTLCGLAKMLATDGEVRRG